MAADSGEPPNDAHPPGVWTTRLKFIRRCATLKALALAGLLIALVLVQQVSSRYLRTRALSRLRTALGTPRHPATLGEVHGPGSLCGVFLDPSRIVIQTDVRSRDWPGWPEWWAPVVYVDLQGRNRGHSTSARAVFSDLQRFPEIRRLDLRDSDLTDVEAGRLTTFRSLESLDLGRTRISDDGLQGVAGLTQLRSLYLDGTKITSAGFEKLQRLTELESLTLSGTQIDDAALSSIARLDGLSFLELSASRISGHHLGKLAAIPGLRYLGLAGIRIDNTAAKEIAASRNLVTLKFDGRDIGHAGLAALATLPKLRSLGLTNLKSEDEAPNPLWQASSLGDLGLTDSQLGEEFFIGIESAPLRSLQLHGTALTDAALECIGHSRALKHLALEGIPLSDATVSRLVALPLEDLSVNVKSLSEESRLRLSERYHSIALQLKNGEHVP